MTSSLPKENKEGRTVNYMLKENLARLLIVFMKKLIILYLNPF